VHITGVVVIYADSLEAATEMSYPFNSCPLETVMPSGNFMERTFHGPGVLDASILRVAL
jgi:hypothetical protein